MTLPSAKVRKAEPKDARGIYESHVRSIRENCARDYTPEQIQAWAGRPYREERRLHGIHNDHVWVVEDSLGVIRGHGHLILKPTDSSTVRAEIVALYLTHEVMGRGLGKRIIELAEIVSREKGASELYLCSTLTARGFYLSQGFTESGPVDALDMYGVAIPYIPMTKRLAGAPP